MGRKKLTPKRAMLSQKPSEEEVRLAARDWAEFLYDEYCIEKHNQLLLGKKRRTIKKLTNHDKLNS
jgi:hypothetical protein